MALILGVIAIINGLGYFAVIWAFRASFNQLRTATWWFATGFMVLAGAIIARGFYWDVLIPLLNHYTPDSAARWAIVSGGRLVNIAFAMMKMAAFYCALKCRHMLISEDERHHYRWYSSWLHPARIGLSLWRR